jgi:hypothetical protein
MAEAPGSRTQPSRSTREATDFEDREGHRAPFASDDAILRQLREDRGGIAQVVEDVRSASGPQLIG